MEWPPPSLPEERRLRIAALLPRGNRNQHWRMAASAGCDELDELRGARICCDSLIQPAETA